MFLFGLRSLLKQSLGLGGLVCLALGVASAQDTSFAQGPQYLAPSGENALFAQSIATPSMAVDGTYPSLQSGASNATLGNTAGAELSTLGLQPEGDMVDLFTVYYGYPPLDLVIGGGEEAEAPVALGGGFRRGSGRVTSIEELRRMGYGLTLGEAARYWKGHPQPAKRTYTNEDVQRISDSK
jgi:hypothetical protein